MDAAGLAAENAVLLTQSTRPEFGQYQANGALPAAKQMKIQPGRIGRGHRQATVLTDVVRKKLKLPGRGLLISIYRQIGWRDSVNHCNSHLGVARHAAPGNGSCRLFGTEFGQGNAMLDICAAPLLVTR